MRRILVGLLFFVSFAHAALPAQKQLQAYFTYCTFNSPENGPYIETYLSIIGNSVEHKKTEYGSYQGAVEVTLLFKQGEEIKNFKKYNLLTPELQDTSAGSFVNFIDQQRISLPNGNYTFDIQLADKNSEVPAFTASQPITINYPKDEITFSDIQLIESYKKATDQSILTKSGYNFVPYVSDYYPKSMEEITFYTEIYNTGKSLGAEEKYLLNYYIESYETGFALNNYRSFSRQTAKPVNVLLHKFDLKQLPSGNYNLVVEARNKKNEEIAKKKLFFQRSNPDIKVDMEKILAMSTANSFVEKLQNQDTLKEYIKSLRPISNNQEKSFADNEFKTADKETMQKFFLNFWQQRNPADPQLEWEKYHRMVRKIDKVYATKVRRGYDTDRGRIYLRYGAPNTVTARPHEPSSYPYEIWHYYKLDAQSDVRFIFYNPDLVTNEYPMLHSTAIGEIRNYRWQYDLQKRNNAEPNLDVQDGIDHFGNQGNELFNNPR